jgi:CubicO group peptidase (beta-lactamase class C family)
LGVHVLVGDLHNESLFTHQRGLLKWESQTAIFSASKWISGTAMMKEVHAGRVGLDDFAHQHLDYWTSDPSDSRSKVTLRHLLGFTSGFSGSASCGSDPFDECVKRIYSNVAHRHAPGERFEYNEVHINLAGGVVTAATGKSVAELIQGNIFTPLKMTETTFVNPSNPGNLGAAFRSSARDYAKFLRAYFLGMDTSAGGIGVDNSEMEKDQYPSAGRSAGDDGWHYGLCNWYDCVETSGWSSECKEARVHSSAGAMGFRPIVDRRLGYYLQIASNSGSGPSMALYKSMKPRIDRIIEGQRAAKSGLQK